MNCRICETAIQPFMSFGKMPIANGFLSPEDFSTEYFYELMPGFCENCLTFQILEQPSPNKMFHENYAFFSRTSKYMVNHFKSYANWVKNTFLTSSDSFVVEIGSNDGAMIENFLKHNIRHLGIEPSENVAEEARKYGINTLCSFFNLETAQKIVSKHGRADALIAANVVCHIPDLHGVARGIDYLLKPEGVIVFEEPYLGDMIENTAYDQIYDEHVYMFSAHSVRNIFKKYGFELIDAKPQKTHGGSMRYVLARNGKRTISKNVEKQIAWLVEEQVEEDLLDEKYAPLERRQEFVSRIMTVLRKWVSTKDAEPFFHEAQSRHYPFGLVMKPDEVANNPHLQDRDWWKEYPTENSVAKGPGDPYQFSRSVLSKPAKQITYPGLSENILNIIGWV